MIREMEHCRLHPLWLSPLPKWRCRKEDETCARCHLVSKEDFCLRKHASQCGMVPRQSGMLSIVRGQAQALYAALSNAAVVSAESAGDSTLPAECWTKQTDSKTCQSCQATGLQRGRGAQAAVVTPTLFAGIVDMYHRIGCECIFTERRRRRRACCAAWRAQIWRR